MIPIANELFHLSKVTGVRASVFQHVLNGCNGVELISGGDPVDPVLFPVLATWPASSEIALLITHISLELQNLAPLSRTPWEYPTSCGIYFEAGGNFKTPNFVDTRSTVPALLGPCWLPFSLTQGLNMRMSMFPKRLNSKEFLAACRVSGYYFKAGLLEKMQSFTTILVS